MTQYAPTTNKHDDSDHDQIVCSDCHGDITARTTPDAVGNPTTTYRCKNCGPRFKTGLTRRTEAPA